VRSDFRLRTFLSPFGPEPKSFFIKIGVLEKLKKIGKKPQSGPLFLTIFAKYSHAARPNGPKSFKNHIENGVPRKIEKKHEKSEKYSIKKVPFLGGGIEADLCFAPKNTIFALLGETLPIEK